MGAGKSTVGARLAKALGWPFLDFDDAVEAATGMTIPRLFAERGEAHFREIEDEVARDLLRREEVVLGSGGGWAAVPGRLRDLPEGTETFWLQVSPQTAVERVGGPSSERPLLSVPDPVREATELVSRRTGAYAAARWTVDTEGRTVEDVTARILEILAEIHPECVALEH